MNNGETIRPIVDNESKDNWIKIDPNEKYDAEKARRAQIAEKEKLVALASGVEPFSVEEALKYYYPDELASDEETIKENMASLEEDYYHSGARNLKEWANEREKYDVYKDSTGGE